MGPGKPAIPYTRLHMCAFASEFVWERRQERNKRREKETLQIMQIFFFRRKLRINFHSCYATSFATSNNLINYALTSLPDSPLSPFTPCFPRKPFRKIMKALSDKNEAMHIS